MDQFAKLTGRQYHLFDYVGAPDAERVVIIMGSGVGAVDEAVRRSSWPRARRSGRDQVRLYRPFDATAFVQALPRSVKSIAVLDRTKEPGAVGEPLHQDVVTALVECWAPAEGNGHLPKVTGGRYGLSSKEFTPAMVKAVLR